MKRRALIAGLAASVVSACSKIADSTSGGKLLRAVEGWNERAHKALRGNALAPEYPRSKISPEFKGNGTLDIRTPEYQAHVANSFTDWRLDVTGLVQRPLALSLEDIRHLPQRTQVTRHDCVEGWSAIGEWTGPQLSTILASAVLKPETRFIVFHCADEMHGGMYYESIDLDDAFHPQTIIAHRLNGEPLPVKNGAPLRMRIERQLGYKQAKYLTRIEAVARLDHIGSGKGGFWEDHANYQWYAGI